MPKPARIDVLPLPVGSYAKPRRGAQLFLIGKFDPAGAPLSPGNKRPSGAFGNRVDCWPGANENDRPCVSYFGELYSERTPRFKVRRLVTRQSSCAKTPILCVRMFEGAWPNWRNSSGRVSKNAALSLFR